MVMSFAAAAAAPVVVANDMYANFTGDEAAATVLERHQRGPSFGVRVLQRLESNRNAAAL